MKEFNITDRESGQRFDKYLKKILKEAPDSFIYKMLRKKNITLNNSKATGKEHIEKGDIVKIFFTDETFEKFSGNTKASMLVKDDLNVIYEDKDIIIINKPQGMLSQKAKPGDISANELIVSHLLKRGELKEEDLRSFTPAVVHRLDRNTTGALAGGKSNRGLAFLSELFRERSIHKFYHCIVKGRVQQKREIHGYLFKDEKTNKVSISTNEIPGSEFIRTNYEPLKAGSELTLLQVELITGKPHQIRAHLAAEGHPIIGDNKYGDSVINHRYSGILKTHSLMLHSRELVFPENDGYFSYLSGESFVAPKPDSFVRLEQLI